MFDLQLAFQTIILIALVILVASLYTAVRALRAEVRRLADIVDPSATRQRAYGQPWQQGQGGAPTPQEQAARASQPQPVHTPQPQPQYSPQSQPARAPQPQPQRQPVAATQPTNAMPVTPPTQSYAPPPPVTKPARPAPPVSDARGPQPQTPPQAAEPQRHRLSLENVLGARVLGILAALLVFAGLVFLAILVAPALTNEVRCAAMFVLSGALAIAGVIVSEKRKTPFSQALLGCGLGSVFVSLLVTYVYFGFLQDIPTIVLMLVWLAACTFLAHRHKSVALVVVAQLGMAISTCFAYAQGIQRGQLPLVVAYQLMACAIVVVGCLRSLERGRMAGIFVSVFVSLAVSQLVVSYYAFKPGTFDRISFIVAMATQFVCVTVLTRLASILASRQRNDEGTAPSSGGLATHLCSEVLWMVALGLDVVLCALLAGEEASFTSKAYIAAHVGLACVAAHWVAAVVFEKTRLIAREMTFFSVYLCATAATLLLAWRTMVAGKPDVLPLVFLVAIAMWVSGTVLREPRHRSSAVAFLVTDALLMACGGYEALNAGLHLPLAPAYVLVLDALLFAWWRTLPEPNRGKSLGPTLLCGTIVTEISLFCAWGCTDGPRELSSVAAFSCCIMLVTALAFLEPQRRWQLSAAVGHILFANEFIVVWLGCESVVGRGPAHYANVAPAAPALAVGICLIAAGVIAYRLVHLAAYPQDAAPWAQVFTGILLTTWAVTTARGLLPTSVGAVVTIVAMVFSLLCIALGFARRLGALRLYGLVTAILCVLKIVIVDVRGTDPVGRVLAFIVGGLICFAISAVYTFAVRRLEAQR